MVRNYLVVSILAVVVLAFSLVRLVKTTQQSGSRRTLVASAIPDLSGVWIVRDYQVSIVPKEGPPLQPSGQAAYRARLRDLEKINADPDREQDPALACIPPGVPRTTIWPLPWELIQAHDRAIIIYEYQSLVRQIFTDGRPHPKNIDPTYMGHSIGRYEGDTLVVDTVGFNDKTWMDLDGRVPHSDALHVVERIHRVDHDNLEDDLTFDDPKAYTKPWTAKKLFMLKPDWQIHEYVCMENSKAQ
jgi:hypothetical protein